MNKDLINITIEEDGTITINTGSISDEIHVSAELFVKEIKDLAGGKVTTSRISGKHEHHHHHGKLHQH